ncbi:MAG: CDP-alcohol phosphatidyltransferase family protein [Sedimentisphaerales bacterium]|nr:CDP-alcohol phosphatidyltransferase family protein [Sedimentisphaerales bacterium]
MAMIKQIPNILTFSRLVLTLVVLVMILYAPRYYANGEVPFPGFLDIAFILFVISGLTDIFDGMAARRLKVTSKFGRMLDPLVDKILVCGAFICFALIGEPKLFNLDKTSLTIIHWLVAAVLIAREAYVTILRHIAEAKGINFAATRSGKLKMFFQSFAIGTVIFKMAHVQTAAWGYWFTTVIFIIMIITTIYSGLRATQRESWKQARSS